MEIALFVIFAVGVFGIVIYQIRSSKKKKSSGDTPPKDNGVSEDPK